MDTNATSEQQQGANAQAPKTFDEMLNKGYFLLAFNQLKLKNAKSEIKRKNTHKIL